MAPKPINIVVSVNFVGQRFEYSQDFPDASLAERVEQRERFVAFVTEQLRDLLCIGENSQE